MVNIRENQGSIEKAGYPNGVPNWGTYLGTPKKTNLSGLLTMLLWLSIIKPINNRNFPKSLVFRVKNIVKNEYKDKPELAVRFFEHPLSMWKRYVIPMKIVTALSFSTFHLHDHFFILL